MERTVETTLLDFVTNGEIVVKKTFNGIEDLVRNDPEAAVKYIRQLQAEIEGLKRGLSAALGGEVNEMG